ncbi:MAG: hypothetical protein PHE02_03790 [Lachnospiraceae bacterium]|nr:hypothetical protein [Lachnospiraceae bacterium]
MQELDKKLTVLSDIAHVLNEKNIIWAIGGSLLLYLKGKTDSFHDIDIMVYEYDVYRLKELLSPMGILAPPNPDKQYRTRHFLEFTIDDVEVDVMAGFVIVKDGNEYDCSLLPEQIAEYSKVNGEMIPLQSMEDWRNYYELMGRKNKVEMIDREG